MIIKLLVVAFGLVAGYFAGRHLTTSAVKAELTAIETAAVADAKTVVARIKAIL